MYFTSLSITLWMWIATSSVLVLILVHTRARWSALRYPPGPKGLPIIGNLMGFPKKAQAQYFHRLSLQYGAFHLRVQFSSLSADKRGHMHMV